MKFRVTAMITPHEGESESQEWELHADNHIDGITDAAKLLSEPGCKFQPTADEVLSVMVSNIDEDQEAIPVYWNAAAKPKRDERDPYGNIERRMLTDKCEAEAHIAEGTHHDRREQYRKAHPEFAMEYLCELQAKEREELRKKCPNTTPETQKA
jgi:hypothetical protein